MVAVLSASILPALDIDPVVSRASATRRRDMPHFAVVVVAIWNWFFPMMRENVVFTTALALIVTVLVGMSKVSVSCLLSASDRVNSALK